MIEKYNCPLEGEITPKKCAGCYASLRHTPCPADISNPDYCREYLQTTPEKIVKEHPDWKVYYNPSSATKETK